MGRAKKREQQLLQAYDIFGDALFRHCYFRLYDREAAKDVVQDVFFRVWEYLLQGKEIDNMRAFVYRTAHNLVIDRVRALNRNSPVSLDDLKEKGFDPKDERTDASRIVDIVLGREALNVLHRLEDPYRTVIVMRYVDDLLPREIAAILGESENVVSVRIYRAVKKVRDLWERGTVHEA